MYEVIFDVFGKKFRTKLEAKSEEEVRYLVLGKIKFEQIKPIGSEVDDILNIFKK
jgi:hypothetical protein